MQQPINNQDVFQTVPFKRAQKNIAITDNMPLSNRKAANHQTTNKSRKLSNRLL
jgi:hypothetical protein